jgi:putative SOS response-associated peptidase YedK
MCGRFVSSSPPDELAKYFDVEQVAETALEPSYNVAPSNDVFVVVESGGIRRLDTFHWGLIPFWAKDVKTGNKMINARAESLAEKNAYKHAFKKRRCIIPADGFYEWKKVPGQKAKQPYFIQRADGEPMAFAGLWEIWRDPAVADDDDPDAWVRSCVIITTNANDVLEPIHSRMPVMLDDTNWDAWLDPTTGDSGALEAMLRPAPDDWLEVYPVSTRVNSPDNNDAELIQRVEPDTLL